MQIADRPLSSGGEMKPLRWAFYILGAVIGSTLAAVLVGVMFVVHFVRGFATAFSEYRQKSRALARLEREWKSPVAHLSHPDDIVERLREIDPPEDDPTIH